MLLRLTAPILAALAIPLAAQSAADAKSVERAEAKPPTLQMILAGGIPKTIDDLRAMEAQHKKLLERVLPCTVSCNGGGSGVIVKGGFVLTCAHVTRRADQRVQIVLRDGTRLRGRSLGLNHRSDAGLVKIEGTPEEIAKLPFAEMGRVKNLKVGQWVAVLGENGGRKSWRMPPLRIGRLLRIPSSGSLVSDCTMSGGDSGGPLFDMDGHVIGINSKIGSNLQSNLHVPIDAFHDEWDKLLRGETTGTYQPQNGGRGGREPAVPGFPAEDLGATADPAVEGEARVLAVRPGSPAAQAGIAKGDVIVGYKTKGGRLRKMRGASALRRRINGFRAGENLKVVVRRGAKELELDVKLVPSKTDQGKPGSDRSGERRRREGRPTQ